MTGTPDAPAAPGKIGWRTWRLAGVMALGALTSMLDSSIVNVGLDTIARDFRVDINDVQWVANAYLLALAVSLPLCGWLGRRVGVGRLWLASLAGFTLTSALCALAPNLTWLVALRVLQGLAAGLLAPAGQTILGNAVGPGRLGRVMAVLGIAVSLGPAIGPALGGVIIAAWSWPWLFLINLPLGAVGLIAGMRLVPRGTSGQAGPLDWAGLALISIGLPLIGYATTAWGERGTLAPAGVWLPLLLGGLGLLGFVLRTVRHRHPLTNLRLFANPVFASASTTATLTGAAMFGALLLFPLYFQVSRGTNVIDTGLSLISYGVGTALTLPLAGRWTDRFGGGAVATVGCLATLATTAPFALLAPDADPVLVQALLLVRGMAIAVAMVPPGIAAYAAVRVEQLPDATMQVNIVQRVGGAIGGALFAVILSRALPSGTANAFELSFWWLTGCSALALASSLWLWRAGRSVRAPGLAQPGTAAGARRVGARG